MTVRPSQDVKRLGGLLVYGLLDCDGHDLDVSEEGRIFNEATDKSRRQAESGYIFLRKVGLSPNRIALQPTTATPPNTTNYIVLLCRKHADGFDMRLQKYLPKNIEFLFNLILKFTTNVMA
jgi:hypothetical protein